MTHNLSIRLGFIRK